MIIKQTLPARFPTRDQMLEMLARRGRQVSPAMSAQEAPACLPTLDGPACIPTLGDSPACLPTFA